MKLRATRNRSNATRAKITIATVCVALSLTACGLLGGASKAGGAGGVFKVATERFISSADTAPEFKAIWKKDPSQGVLNRNDKIFRSLDPGVARVAPDGLKTAADTLLDQIRSSSANVITLIGHNEADSFMLPDGSFIPLTTLYQQRPQIVLISCDSARSTVGGNAAGLPGSISLIAAVEVEKDFIQKVNSLDYVPTIEQTQGLLNASAASVEQLYRDRTTLRISVGSGIVIGAGGSIIVNVSE